MTVPVTTRIYLVRHGETDWNRARRLQGVLDVSLNPAGVIQARRLAARFNGTPVSSIVSSPLARAHATAAAFARTLACPLRTDARLREIDHGSWTGLTLPDIGRRFPDLVRHDQLLPDAFNVSGGEQPAAVYRRASAALRDLVDGNAGGSVVVVGHGVTHALLWCAATGVHLPRFHECLQPNLGVVALTFRRRDLVAARTIDAAEPFA